MSDHESWNPTPRTEVDHDPRHIRQRTDEGASVLDHLCDIALPQEPQTLAFLKDLVRIRVE
ncbi:MAG: hypothetical protein ABJH68_19025 [Ilumatobacter sp.]|uniref:hypothetical protein n=1 Tax=Ilumatobacter sp. TaxID=1967498 RepID=UPI003297974D